MKIKLDFNQEEVLKANGNIVLRSGRQCGKSTVISVKAGEFAVKNRKKTILVIASVERQAYLLFEKILSYLLDNYKSYVMQGKDRPTKSRVKLKNGSIIYCLPTGLTGHGIRGYTVDLLIADEAAFIPEEVWSAVTPMLSTTEGQIILLSTPFGKDSYFYRCFQDSSFKKFHWSSEDCPRINKEFLKREKERMSRLQYAQEYLGEFVDELLQFFPTDLIKKTLTLLPPGKVKNPYFKYFLGVDVARLGGDESTFVVLEKTTDKTLIMKELITSDRMLSPQIIGQIKALHRKYDFTKIYIDDGGLGAPIFDMLLEDDLTRRVVVGINNSAKPLDREEKRRRKILKEDLYHNLLSLMESNQIKLLESPELVRSLSSVQYEYNSDGFVRIFGNYTHIAEGLIRAAWCVKDKSLNIWISSI